MFSDEQVKSLMKQSGLLAPSGKPVGPGDSWPVEFEQGLGGMGMMVIKGGYTYKKMEEVDGKPCALLNFAGNISMKPGAKNNPNLPPGMEIKITGGKMTNVTHFDPEAGIARKTVTDVEMVMEMTDPQAPEGKMKLPIKQKVTMTVKEK